MCDKSAGSTDINENNVRESCVLTVLTRIHNIGHIHNTNFAQTQFSTSTPQKTHFLKSQKVTFLKKYLVCGFKIEISEYPTNFMMSPTHPINMSSIGLKLMKIERIKFPLFFSLTVYFKLNMICYM